MSEKRLGELHLYKELMTSEERSDRYRLLKLSGATAGNARRWRDWSTPHFNQMLDYLCQPHNLEPNVSEQ